MSSGLVRGARVLIVGNGSTHHRHSQLVGKTGIIYYQPVHPVTWFKVQFPDGVIHTFRPSAMQLVDANGAMIGPRKRPYSTMSSSSGARHAPSSSSHSSSSSVMTNTDADIHARLGVQGGVGRDNTNAPRLLSYTDAEGWTGKEVRIITGRLAGTLARVASTGNGWVQLETATGDLAKRAHELTLDVDWTRQPGDGGGGGGHGGFGGEYEDDDMSSVGDGKALRTSRSGRVLHGPSYGSRSSRSNSDVGFPQSSDSSQGGSVGSPSRDTGRQQQLQLQRQHDGPLIHPDIVAKRREFIQAAVDKERAKIGNRPDLTYWKHMLDRGDYDAVNERNAARDFVNTMCECCLESRWQGSKFCWNQSCALSPIYWRLPGASGMRPPMAFPSMLGGEVLVLTGPAAAAAAHSRGGAGTVTGHGRGTVVRMVGGIEVISDPGSTPCGIPGPAIYGNMAAFDRPTSHFKQSTAAPPPSPPLLPQSRKPTLHSKPPRPMPILVVPPGRSTTSVSIKGGSRLHLGLQGLRAHLSSPPHRVVTSTASAAAAAAAVTVAVGPGSAPRPGCSNAMAMAANVRKFVQDPHASSSTNANANARNAVSASHDSKENTAHHISDGNRGRSDSFGFTDCETATPTPSPLHTLHTSDD